MPNYHVVIPPQNSGIISLDMMNLIQHMLNQETDPESSSG